MPDDSPIIEAEIIHAAYADKVKEAFMVFAENLSVGQAEKSCKERFQRSLLMIKKARDLALEATTERGVEPAAPGVTPGAASDQAAGEALSAEDQAMIDAAVGGTTGVAAGPARPGKRVRSRLRAKRAEETWPKIATRRASPRRS